MLDLRIEFDYLVVDTLDWLNDISEANDELTESLAEYLGDDYATVERVTEWLTETFGERPTGIYGDGDPVQVSTCNEDSFLSRDISFVFARTDAGTFIIDTGVGYFLRTGSSATVRDFLGHDDAEAFSYSQGGAAHADPTSQCAVDWIIESGYYLYPNGGGMNPSPIDQHIRDGALHCPECGGELYAVLY